MNVITKSRIKNFFQGSPANKIVALAVVVVVGLAGYWILAAKASTFFASTEPDSGTLSGNAKVVSDATASGGKALQFNAPATTTPPPTGGGTGSLGLCTTIPSTPTAKPTASNTGVPTGTALSTTPPAGVTVTSDSWKVTADGTVINGKDIQNKWVDVEANNVVIENSRIHAPDGGGSAIARGNNDNVPNLTVINSEVYSSGGAYNGILATSGSKICGVNAHNFENIVEVEGTGIIVQSSYLHINQAAPGKSDPHNDGMEVRAGSSIQILGNNITQTNPDESWQHNTSALYLGATYGDLTNITVNGNWFGGGTYSLYMVTVPVGAHKLGAFTVTNNKWYRGSYQYGQVSTDDGSSWKPATWANNTFEDNGQAVGI